MINEKAIHELLEKLENQLAQIAGERESLVANFNVSVGVLRGKEFALEAQIKDLKKVLEGEKQQGE